MRAAIFVISIIKYVLGCLTVETFTTRGFQLIRTAIYHNMASVEFIVVLIVTVCVDITWTQRTGTEVDASLLMEPVTLGGVMAFQCRIRNMREEYSVDFVRFHNGRIEPITSRTAYQESSLQNRVFLASRVFPDRTHVYVLTLVDVSYDDEGEYLCSVQHTSRQGTSTIATGTINIDIYSYPMEIYPYCESVPSQPITLYVGNKIVLSCTSEKGNPVAELKWSCTDSNVQIIPRNTSTAGMVSSEVTLISDMSYHGAVFTCHLSSPGFPNRERSCHIGPIIMHNLDNVIIKQPVIAADTGRDQIVNHNIHVSNTGCNSDCSPEDEDIVLYLTIGTIGASILCILFLTTTIIFCYKYHSISTEALEAMRTVPINDGSDPVYVSLQRRQEYDRNSICSTYMTVEDPNNPGSKVHMPKEVFEEFYKTLTIKRV